MLRNGRPEFREHYEIEIFAPPDKVWDWLSRVDMWTSWRQDVTCAYWINGQGQNGTLKWRLRKMLGFTANVAVWRREREMSWHATSYGTRVDYSLMIDGDYRSTVVRMDVYGDGGLLKFLPTRVLFLHNLNRSNEIWLGALKTKLEAGKDDSTSPPPGLDNPYENSVKLPSELGPFDRFGR